MIVFIVLNSLFDELLIETHLHFHLCDQLLIYIQFFGVKTEILIFWLMHKIKRVSTDAVNVDSFFRISHKELGYHIFRVSRKKFRQSIFSRKNLFV